MSQEAETSLRRALNVIDSIRRRVLVGGWVAVVVTLGAYAHFYYVQRRSGAPGRLVSASLSALTCLIAWGEFAGILIVVRMAMRILRAIDLMQK